MTTRLRRVLRGLLVLPVVAGVVSLVPAGGALASSTRAPVSERQVTVMTRNLYLGADLTHILTGNPLTGMVQVVSTVEALQPPRRMAEVAAEITAAKPDLVALQEVADWHIAGFNPFNPSQQVVPAANYDFLALLQQSLADAGAPYHVVVAQTNFDSATQLPSLVATLATFADRDVILARNADPVSQLKVLDTYANHYTAQLTIPITALGTSINFDRGYEWADVQTRGKVWRLVNTHPEAYSPSDFGASGPDINGLEAGELVQALAGDSDPTVVAGDLNSKLGDPSRAGYATLVAAGFADTWLALGKSDSDFTCCRNETLTDTPLYERIDHVLGRGLVTPVSAAHVGVDPVNVTPPLWPSDHAGVVTTVAVGKE